jgi:hypothetical protein
LNRRGSNDNHREAGLDQSGILEPIS